MISSHVKNVCTSIPRLEALNVSRNKLSNNNKLNIKETDEIIQSTNVIFYSKSFPI